MRMTSLSRLRRSVMSWKPRINDGPRSPRRVGRWHEPTDGRRSGSPVAVPNRTACRPRSTHSQRLEYARHWRGSNKRFRCLVGIAAITHQSEALLPEAQIGIRCSNRSFKRAVLWPSGRRHLTRTCCRAVARRMEARCAPNNRALRINFGQPWAPWYDPLGIFRFAMGARHPFKICPISKIRT